MPEQFAVNMRNNGINENAALINRGAVIMEIKNIEKRNTMYNLARVNGQPPGIVEISLYHHALIFFGGGKSSR